MTYIRPRKNQRARLLQIGGAILAAFALILIAILFLAPSFMPGLFTAIARPFWRTSFAIQSGALESPSSLLSENESLKTQLAGLKTQLASSSVEAIFEQNIELKALLGRASTTPLTAAAVLERPPLIPYDELIIDLGSTDGISTTTLVYAPGSVLIGRVSDVYSQTSKALLFSSPGQTYPVLIGSSHVPATASGRGGGQYQAQVPHGSAVQQGDVVSDSSFSDGIFGMVVSVTSDSADPFDEVLIAPPVNLYGIRWVLVDAKPKR